MNDRRRRPLPPPPGPPGSSGAETDAPPPTARRGTVADEPTFEAHPSAFVGVAADEDGEITERRETLAPALERTVPVLTVLTGTRQGQLLQIEGNTCRLGRGQRGSDIVLDDIGVSRHHARIKRWIGQAFVLEDLGSTNGSFINGKRVQRHSLANGDIIQLGPNLRLRFDVIDASEAELRRQLFAGNVRDPGTRLYRREHLDEQVRAEVAHGRRHETDVALILVRVDEPESLEPGPGDRILGQVAARVVERGRIEDVVARFDERTVAMLQRATDLAAAEEAAAGIVAAVADKPFELAGRALTVRVSVGIATLEHMEVFAEYDALIEDAVAHLAAAVEGPRGRIGTP